MPDLPHDGFLRLKVLLKSGDSSQTYVYLFLKYPTIYFHPGLLPSAAYGSFPGLHPVSTTDTPIRLVEALAVKGDHL